MTPILDLDMTALIDERRDRIRRRLAHPLLGMRWGDAADAAVRFPERMAEAREALQEALRG